MPGQGRWGGADHPVTHDGATAEPSDPARSRSRQGTRDPSDDPVAAARHAAEVVRRHLVSLRGGAPFLSAADGALLVRWLDEGVPLHRILRALETASDKRLARRVRAPLTLRHAARHLGAPRATRLPAPVVADSGLGQPPGAEGPLGDVIASLRASPVAQAVPDHTARVADQLAQARPGDAAEATALVDAVAALFDAAWRALDAHSRAPYLAQATAQLADLLDEVDEGERARLLDTWGRSALRAAVPGCRAATLLDRLDTD